MLPAQAECRGVSFAFRNRDKKWLERPNGLALVEEFGEFVSVKVDSVMLTLEEEEQSPFFFSVCRLDADFDGGYFPSTARAVGL